MLAGQGRGCECGVHDVSFTSQRRRTGMPNWPLAFAVPAAGLKERLLVTAALLLLALLARHSRGTGPSQHGGAITWRRLAEDVLAAEQCGRSGTVDELANCLNSRLNQTAAAAVPATRAEVVLGGGGGAAGWGGYVRLRDLVPTGGSVPATSSGGSKAQPTVEWCAGACMSTSLCNCFLVCEQHVSKGSARCRCQQAWLCCFRLACAERAGCRRCLLALVHRPAREPHARAGRLPR